MLLSSCVKRLARHSYCHRVLSTTATTPSHPHTITHKYSVIFPPEEYKTIYNIEATANINHPDIHKIMFDFTKIVQTENLTMINLFYRLYIEDYEFHIRGNVSKKFDIIHDIGWKQPIHFSPGYSNKLMNMVLLHYIWSLTNEELNRDISYRELLYFDVNAHRKRVLGWFCGIINPGFLEIVKKNIRKSKQHTGISKLLDSIE